MHHVEFRLPGVSLRVLCSVPGIVSQLREVYSDGEEKPSRQVDITFRVLTRTNSEGDRVYTLEENGQVAFLSRERDILVPYLTWMINLAVSRRAEGCLTFHAGAVSFKNMGIMLPAESRCGKSTLTLALLLRGCKYLSDDIAILDHRHLHLVPFRKSLSMRSGTFALFPQFQEYFSARSSGQTCQPNGQAVFVPPRMVREDCFSEPCPLGLIVFPSFNPGQGTRFEPLGRSKAVLKLLQCCFNLGGSIPEGIDWVIAAVRQADCFTLTYDNCETAGERILHAAGQRLAAG